MGYAAYHYPMHRIVLIIMIALLPLRSWAGDVMAMDMTVQHLVAINIEAGRTDATMAGNAFDSHSAANPGVDCPGHGATGSSLLPGAVDPSDTPANGHCSTCGICQICHVVALANTAAGLAPAIIATPLLPFGSTRFTSAPSALGLKPPIS